MTRTMYDALYTGGIPAGAQMAAWYPYDARNTDGPPRDARQVLTIDNTAGAVHADCDILDVETGAATFADVPGWLSRCTAPYPTIYCSLSNTSSVFSAAGSQSRHWYLWVARYLATPAPVVPPVPGLPSGCTVIGCQYEAAGAYDLSIITDDNWYPEADVETVSVQNGWRWCEKCGAMYFPGPANACAGGGQHEPGPSFDYAATYSGS
jgi:hypothetical protein